jgi:hypothetical protein
MSSAPPPEVGDPAQTAATASRTQAPGSARGSALVSPAPSRPPSAAFATPSSAATVAASEEAGLLPASPGAVTTPPADEAPSSPAAPVPGSALPPSRHAAPASAAFPVPEAGAPDVPAGVVSGARTAAAALAAARPAVPAGAPVDLRNAPDGTPASGASTAETPDQPRVEHAPAGSGSAARPRAAWPASAGMDVRVATASGERRGESGITVRAGERRGVVAANGTPAAAAHGVMLAQAETARDAAVRQAAVAAAPAARSVEAFVQQADPMAMRPLTAAGGAASYDAVLAAAPEPISGGRGARTDSARESAAFEGTRGPEPAAIEGATPVEASPMSLEGLTSAGRATAADEPAQPDGVRAPVVDQVVTRLSELRRDGSHEITMRLDPPELGGLTIDARLEGTRLTVHIRAEHGATQELLAEALPRLRESLAQQGFVAEQVSVQLGLEGGGGSGGGTAREHARPFEAPAAPVPTPAAPARAPRASAPASVPGTRVGLDVWA